MNKHLCLFYLNLFLVLSFIGFSVFIILDPDAMNGVTLEEYNNTFCQTYNKTGENDPVELICENKFKKNSYYQARVLYLLVALGLSYSVVNFFFDFYTYSKFI